VPGLRRTLIHRLPPLACPLLVVLLILLPMLLPAAWQERLEYQAMAIADGQWWRLISGHLVHLGWGHLSMNLLGFLLIWELFLRNRMTARRCLFGLFALTLICSLGLYLFSPQVAWYRGLSGVLHGLLVWALLRGLAGQPVGNGLLLGLLAAKLAWEQWSGPLPGSEAVAQGLVIVDAHLYGAVGGGLLWGLELGVRRIRNEVTE